MKQLVLYCKSYIDDIERLKKLYQSIQSFNIDYIPFYISVPKQDLEIFKSKFPLANIICDDEVYNGKLKGWQSQQIIKSCFYKTGISKNWVCIDSDGYFIKSFKTSDFMLGVVPYTVMHEQKDLFTWTASNREKLGFNPHISFKNDRLKIMEVFDRNGRYYDFGPSPTIWSSKVWQDFEELYMKPHKITWDSLIQYCPSEFTWYGESLLHYNSIPLLPCEPLFKVFHYKQQWDEYKNIDPYTWAENYLGIIIQSNFT
jgi:hypothetical protein